MKYKRTNYFVTSLGSILFISGISCSKSSGNDSSGDPADSAVLLSGQLAVSSSTTGLRLVATNVDDLSVYCVSFSFPPVAGTGDVESDGKFSLSIAASGTSIGCFVLDSAQAVLGTMVFKDPSKKTLGGEGKTSDRIAFEGGSSDLGQITLDLDTGKVEVDVSQIAVKKKDISGVAASGDTFDFTGTYKFALPGLDTLPTGYQTLCSMAEQEAAEAARQQGQDDRRCDGPVLDMPIYFKRIAGRSTADGTPIYALSGWQSEQLDLACGRKLGLSYAKASTFGVDFSASGVAEGEPNWAAAFADGWKDTANARAQYTLMDMEEVDNFKGYPGTKQYFLQYRTLSCNANGCTESAPQTDKTGFQFFANTKESGCRDQAGNPVRLDDWSGMNCSFEPLSGDSLGLGKNTCTKTVDATTYSCVNISGTFAQDGSVIANAVTRFPNDFRTFAQEGDLCSSIVTTSNAGKLAQLRCYADAADMGGDSSSEALCRREIDSNWAAKTPEEFIINDDGPAKAQGQFIFELFEYDSANSGSLRSEHRSYRGVQSGDNWTECEMMEVFSLSVQKQGDSNDLYGEMVMSDKNVSPKPACKAAIGEEKIKKYTFKLIKQ